MSMMTRNQMQEETCKVFTDLRAGKLDLKTAAELNNTTGKYLQFEKLKFLEEAMAKKYIFQMPLLETPSVKPPKLKSVGRQSKV